MENRIEHFFTLEFENSDGKHCLWDSAELVGWDSLSLMINNCINKLSSLKGCVLKWFMNLR